MQFVYESLSLKYIYIPGFIGKMLIHILRSAPRPNNSIYLMAAQLS